MNIVVLDGYTVNPGDLTWEPLEKLGDACVFERTSYDQILPRAASADVLVVNKVRINADHLRQLPNLKCICLLATGYDNVDIAAAKSQNIPVFNAVGYGTESVAQHTMAMMLAFTNKIETHHRSVREGQWSSQDDFSYSLNTVTELAGKNLGIIGFGKIGSRVGELAQVFGMNILTTSKRKFNGIAKQVSSEELYRSSHYISLHAPLTEETHGMINDESLRVMRRDAVIINTGRGDLINENHLVEALLEERIGGAILDVLGIEPPLASNRLLHLKNVVVTPHMAWRSKEARNNLINIVAKNIVDFSNGRMEKSLV
ncbi:MAG: D-2-hydroxyacid dehydrogenase [Saprospiraceae bacterium]|nr:D-2-hydroxyacid dehydrogenase [Saprospiraceae bacterium]